jgi:hypothetical protein
VFGRVMIKLGTKAFYDVTGFSSCAVQLKIPAEEKQRIRGALFTRNA